MSVETVTLLFTDVVGSTALMSRLGERAADAVRRDHMARLRRAINAVGGHEVKTTGDGVMAVFPSARAALECAIAMQRNEARRPAGEVAVEVRIGVAAGEVDVEGGDYFGVPVVEAARLCATAGPAEILTTDMVRRLVASRGGFPLQGRGPATLKGLCEPVEVWSVDWSATTPVIPVPGNVVTAASATMVGRDAELEAIGAAVDAIWRGERRGVLVSGEPGIGKTTLAASAALAAAGRGAVVVSGRCDEELHRPYQPWAQALDHLVEHLPVEFLGEHVDEVGVVLARIVPRLATRVPAGRREDVADIERGALFDAVDDLLGRAATLGPVVVVLDDLHWADVGSVQLVHHLLTADGLHDLLVLATFRDSDLEQRTRSPTRSPGSTATSASTASVSPAWVTTRSPSCWAGSPVARSMPGRWRSRTSCWSKPTGTRSSSASCCATSARPGSCERTSTDAGTRAVQRTPRPSRSASGKSSNTASAGSVPTHTGC
jgi:hypothetical protein